MTAFSRDLQMGFSMNMRLGFGIALTAMLVGCGGSSGGAGTGSTTDACVELDSSSFSCADMLNDLVEFGARPLTDDFKTQSQALHDATDAYCAPLIADGTDTASNLTAAQTAWVAAADTVQQLAVMQFGPFVNDDTSFASIYAWPTVSACNVDLQVVSGALGSDNRAGMFAMEYLLFSDKGSKSCTTEQSTTVAQWFTDNDAAARQVDRCEYAQLVADDLVTKASTMESIWNEYDLSDASSTLQAAAGKVTDALFYIDKQTKDAKIKAALPQASDESFTASALESQFANDSKEAIIANLQAAKRLLTANDAGTGLDDYLIAAGQQTIATNMIATLDVAIVNAQAIEGSLFDAVNTATDKAACVNLAGSGSYDANSSDIDALCALQYNIKQFTDILKGDFVLTTSFSVPASADGDAD